MPVSFGVLLLGLGLTWVAGLLLSGLMLRQTHLQVSEATRGLELRLGRQVAQLSASNAALRAQQTTCAETQSEQARELELLNARLEALRTRSAGDGRAARSRRGERH